MKYEISKTCPAAIIFQALDSGYYDYSEFESMDAAWEAEQKEDWVKSALAHGQSLDEVEAEFLSTLTESTAQEAMQAAQDGYSWPTELGYVNASAGAGWQPT